MGGWILKSTIALCTILAQAQLAARRCRVLSTFFFRPPTLGFCNPFDIFSVQYKNGVLGDWLQVPILNNRSPAYRIGTVTQSQTLATTEKCMAACVRMHHVLGGWVGCLLLAQGLLE